jgi:hypothetical protein
LLKRLDLKDFQPYKLTLRQTPKNISNIINPTAIKTIGLTGANIDSIESKKRESLVFIWVVPMG